MLENKQKLAYIYKITCLVNNKVYIGSTKHIDKRKRQHFYLLERKKHSCKHFQAAFNKYGEDAFEFTLLYSCKEDERKEKEICSINEYKCLDKRYGYNTMEVDENGFKHSEITRKKMKNARISRGYTIPVVAYNIKDGRIIGEYESAKQCISELNIPYSSCVYQVLSGANSRYKDMTFRRKGEVYDYKFIIERKPKYVSYKKENGEVILQTFTKEQLENLLFVEKKTYKEISLLFNCSESTTRRLYSKFGIYLGKVSKNILDENGRIISRICLACNTEKDINNFYTKNDRKNGYQSNCIT